VPKTKKMKKAIYRTLISAGVLLLLVAVGILIYSRVDDHMAGVRAQRLLDQVLSGEWDQPVLTESAQRSPLVGRSAAALEFTDDELEIEDDEGSAPGDTVIGILEIPSLDLTLPVLNGCSYALLDISVGRYMGSIYDKPERLVIAGHNFKSHFGGISTLKTGDKMKFQFRTVCPGLMARAEIYKNNQLEKVYYGLPANRISSYEDTYEDTVQEGPSWYFVKIIQVDGGSAWSSPIFIQGE